MTALALRANYAGQRRLSSDSLVDHENARRRNHDIYAVRYHGFLFAMVIENKAAEIFKEKKRNNKEKKCNEKESINIVPLKRFVPPTEDEVALYCLERRNHVNAQKFVDYYSSNGWKVGRNPMKDWKAAVRTWERSEITEKDYQREIEYSDLPY